MQFLRLLCLICVCFVHSAIARPEGSSRVAMRFGHGGRLSARRNVVARLRKSSPTKNGGEGVGAAHKSRRGPEPKPVRRFLGGTKSTTNLTTTSTFAPKLANSKLENKATKYTTTLANTYPTKTSSLSSIRHETLSSAGHMNNPSTVADSRMYTGESGGVYGNEVSNMELGKSSIGSVLPYSRVPTAMSTNPPLNGHGMSSAPGIYTTEMVSTTTTASSEAGRTHDLDTDATKYANSWPLFSVHRNDHTEEQPVKAFYGSTNNRNQFRGPINHFENASRAQTPGELIDPIIHNMDPSVKYNVASAPNTAEKIPTFTFAGFNNNGAPPNVVAAPGGIQEHKEVAQIRTGSNGGLALPGNLGDDPRKQLSYAVKDGAEPFGTGQPNPSQMSGLIADDTQTTGTFTDTDWTNFEHKSGGASSVIFSATEPRSISDSQSEYIPAGVSDKLAPIYSMSHSSDIYSSRPVVNHVDAFGGRYSDDKTQNTANSLSESNLQDAQEAQQEAVLPGQNNGANETPAAEVSTSNFVSGKVIPHESLIESSGSGGSEFGVIGHRGFACQPRTFIGAHSGYHSESSFDTALDRHSEHRAETRQTSIDDSDAVYSSRVNLYDSYLVGDQMQAKGATPEIVSCSIAPGYENFEGTYPSSVNFDGYMRVPVRRRSFKVTRRAKVKG